MAIALKMKLNTTRKASIPQSVVKQSNRLRDAPETTLKEQTLRQLRKLFEGCTEGYIVTIPSFDDNRPVAGKKFRYDQIEDAARHILKNNVQYLKPVLMGDRVMAERYAVGGTGDVTEIKVIGFDIDTAEKASKYLPRGTVEALLQELECPPSMVIETRKGAGLHVYWTLSDATKISSDNRDSIKSIVKRFNQFICSKIEGTDEAGNLDRVLRCAGTKREDGSMVQVLNSNRRKYTLDEIAGFAESIPEESTQEYLPKSDAGDSWNGRLESSGLTWDEIILGHTSIMKDTRGQYVHPSAKSGQASIAKADQFFGVLIKSDTLRGIIGSASCPVADFVYKYEFHSNNAKMLDWLDQVAPKAAPEFDFDFTSQGSADDQESFTASVGEMVTPDEPPTEEALAKMLESKGIRPSISSTEFADMEITTDPIIDGVLIRDHSMIICGSEKTFKTTLAVDLAVSLATGTPFLDREDWRPAKPEKVLLFSAESGDATLKETGVRISESKGKGLKDCGDNLLWAFWVPNVTDNERMLLLEIELAKVSGGVVIFDPMYFMLSGDSDNNRSKFAAEFGPINDACKRHSVTLIVVDHTNKGSVQGENKNNRPHLQDMNGNGRTAFFRSWMGIKRRGEYERNQPHNLMVQFGGSCLGVTGGSNWMLTLDEAPTAEQVMRGIRGYNIQKVCTLAEAETQLVFEQQAKATEKREEKEKGERLENAGQIVTVLRSNPIASRSEVTLGKRSAAKNRIEALILDMTEQEIIEKVGYTLGQGGAKEPLSGYSEIDQKALREGKHKKRLNWGYSLVSREAGLLKDFK